MVIDQTGARLGRMLFTSSAGFNQTIHHRTILSKRAHTQNCKARAGLMDLRYDISVNRNTPPLADGRQLLTGQILPFNCQLWLPPAISSEPPVLLIFFFDKFRQRPGAIEIT